LLSSAAIRWQVWQVALQCAEYGSEAHLIRERVIKSLLAAAALASLGLAATQPAHATLQIAALFGSSTFFCADNSGTGCDTNPAIGTIQVANQTLGGIQVNGSIQTSLGTPANPDPLDILNTGALSLINITAAPVDFTVTVSDTDFAGPANSFATSGSGVCQTASGSTIALNWFNDPANAQGADNPTDTPGSLIDTFTSTAVGAADSFSHNNTGPASDPGPFSMTEQAIGTLVGHGELLNRGQTEIKTPTPIPVPEPASLAILGLGLLGLAGIRRRRRS